MKNNLNLKQFKSHFLEFYEQHETRFDIGFFLVGFILDVFTLSDIDDPLSILQQIAYLIIIGSILYFEFINSIKPLQMSERISKIWNYRQLILHFFLGSLLSIYSLFFLKSSSLFSSLLFILFIVGMMILNEVKSFQRSRVDLKIALYVICIFCFFSMLVPVILGFVGILPFILALACTCSVIYFVFKQLQRKIQDRHLLYRRLLAPSIGVISVFVIFYIIGWIPPVPLSVQNMGIYHMITKNSAGQYLASHENPWWRFWHKGDQAFQAEPGDKVYFFAQIFSPGRFDDSVILHWFYNDPKQGWLSTDRVSMRVTGGRKNGYRGFSVKQNYTPGEWRISVETTDSREIGRIYFTITPVEPTQTRQFKIEIF